VILVDANLLLYAYHPQDERHQAAKEWLEATLSGTEPVRFAWLSLWAFLRISTNPRVFERPLLPTEAAAVVSSWLARSMAGVLDPGERHLEILHGLLRGNQVKGPLITDAALASLALEHGATLCTTDADFSRFPGLRHRNPIAVA
jgi:uncharacterized protein